MAEMYTSRELEKAMKGRGVLRWAGNLRVWDVLNRYTGKQYSGRIRSLHTEINRLSTQLEGPTTEKERDKLISNIRAKSTEFVKTFEEMLAFRTQLQRELTELKTELGEKGEVSRLMERRRDVITRLGRGNINSKMQSLSGTLERYYPFVNKLKALLDAEHFEDMQTHNTNLADSHKRLKQALGVA